MYIHFFKVQTFTYFLLAIRTEYFESLIFYSSVEEQLVIGRKLFEPRLGRFLR